MNAIEGAIERLDRLSYGLFEEHLTRCYSSGGVVILTPRFVFLGAAWDPVDGDDQHTLAVMHVEGDAAGEIQHVVYRAQQLGFTHAVWCREVSRGDGRVRKISLDRFGKLCQKCHGKRLVP